MQQPEVTFFHDSLGRPITEGILSREGIKTTKKLTYKLGDVAEMIVREPIKSSATVIHVGTNNLDESADSIIKKTVDIVNNVKKNSTTKLILSNIIMRANNPSKQSKLEYINGYINMMFEKDDRVSMQGRQYFWIRA